MASFGFVYTVCCAIDATCAPAYRPTLHHRLLHEYTIYIMHYSGSTRISRQTPRLRLVVGFLPFLYLLVVRDIPALPSALRTLHKPYKLPSPSGSRRLSPPYIRYQNQNLYTCSAVHPSAANAPVRGPWDLSGSLSPLSACPCVYGCDIVKWARALHPFL